MNKILETNLENREKMIKSVSEEIIGPTVDFTLAELIDENVKTLKSKGSFYYYKNLGKKEEIFTNSKPSRKYAAGILYPRKSIDKTNNTLQEETELQIELNGENQVLEDSEDEKEIVEPSYRPMRQSTMGFTFAVPAKTKELNVRFSCGAYSANNQFNTAIQKGREWWFRKSLFFETDLDIQYKTEITKKDIVLYDLEKKQSIDHKIRFYSHIRELNTLNTKQRIKIITLTFENISTKDNYMEEELILFQCKSEVSSKFLETFLPYPNASDLEADIPEEDKKFEFLYLEEKNYSFGHDCSTKWIKDDKQNVKEIHTTFLPEYEITTITPDIEINGENLEIRHIDLAGVKNYLEVKDILLPLIDGYKIWFLNLEKKVVDPYYEDVKNDNLKQIKACIKRLEKGLEYLREPDVFNCFRLTNYAMLMQMNNGKQNRTIKKINNEYEFTSEYENMFSDFDYKSLDELALSLSRELNRYKTNNFLNNFKWRGFQIAFLIQSIESIVNKKSKDREAVDLIWFPTGGGKTEAYLAVAAFSMIYRRLLNQTDNGVDVMMRYTLRLLTADQFQRSARLICSLEYLRRHFPSKLGKEEYSIGLWVGSSTTPNTNVAAKNSYLEIINNERPGFIVESCPWCGAEMEPSFDKYNNSDYPGYRYHSKLEVFCPDKKCIFHDSLPIYFVDEQLYKKPPTFLIGTIDKFVQLTWKPEARSLFGLGENGERLFTPPNLIIQDELHLISGPLGTLTGMYEVLIDELSTDFRNDDSISAKIIGATATIKSYQEQIHAIFGRETSKVFPPSGFDINDNYFSTVERNNETGELSPGRKYLGIYTTTQGKLQTQVQTMSALIREAGYLDELERDPFWTILSFYNTIRDIGSAISLTEQDIPNNLNNHYKWKNISKGRIPKRENIKELTSRMSSSMVSKSISELKVPYESNNLTPIDICLASNIIEVGVDIDRLSLMTIVGQPKTTSQYIQVSGRVGRRTHERPGLVVVIYNPGNSTDKSHFEHFNEYHQKLYGQVEISSVTPFSDFAIQRGLPAVLIGYMRQNFQQKSLGNQPSADYIEQNAREISEFIKKIILRAQKIEKNNPDTSLVIRDEAEKLLNTLLENDYESWMWRNNNYGFMAPMTKDSADLPDNIKPVILSMRTVDASSRLVLKNITTGDSLLKRGFDF